MFFCDFIRGGGGGVPLGPPMFNHRKFKHSCMAHQDNVVQLSVHYGIS